jgi:propionyl-CoA carboxylase alpha chain
MPTGWTNGRLPNQKIVFEFEGEDHPIEYKQDRDENFIFSSSKIASIFSSDAEGIDVLFNNKRHYSRITFSKNQILIHMPFGDVMLFIKPKFITTGIEAAAGGLIAPMPGKVIEVKVRKGKKVKAGETLIVLEAMKMEHSIKASKDGTVSELLISLNDQVENGALLMIVK